MSIKLFINKVLNAGICTLLMSIMDNFVCTK